MASKERTYRDEHRNYWIQEINKRDPYGDYPDCRHGHLGCAVSDEVDDCIDEIISVYEITGEDCDI